MIRLLRWSERSRWRRLVLMAGLLLVPGGIGLAVGHYGGVAVVFGSVVGLVVLVLWLLATTPPRPPRQSDMDD